MYTENEEKWSSDDDYYKDEVNDFKFYVEKNWIGAYTRNRPRRNPLYRIETWNKFNRIINSDLAITNNGNENFNSTWNPGVPKSASVWTVIDCFKMEESLRNV